MEKAWSFMYSLLAGVLSSLLRALGSASWVASARIAGLPTVDTVIGSRYLPLTLMCICMTAYRSNQGDIALRSRLELLIFSGSEHNGPLTSHAI